MRLSFKFVQEFARRRLLKKKVQIEFRDDAGRPRLFCDEPVIVARFASARRQAARRRFGEGTKMLMRGQTQNYQGMVPGLFRLTPTETATNRLLLCAEERFEEEIQNKIKLGRLRRPNLAALLQHYGYRTSWLDVVEDLRTAVWFATHSIVQLSLGVRTARSEENETGWIYFIASVPCRSCAIDLREEHHGLSLRPHTQGGWSVRGAGDDIFDMKEWVIGCVEFPNDKRWALSGYLVSGGFFFPSVKLDDTLKRLIDKRVDEVAASVEQEIGVHSGSLGRVYSLVKDTA